MEEIPPLQPVETPAVPPQEEPPAEVTEISEPGDNPPVKALAAVKQLKPLYDCLKCPAYCCSYERINVSKRDITRLAKHFGITFEQATRKFTKIREGERVLRHQKDKIYGTICMNIDQTTRKCSVYEARPAVCREYPEKRRCGYYEFLAWERKHQANDSFIPLEKG